jgi:hypothetical protein
MGLEHPDTNILSSFSNSCTAVAAPEVMEELVPCHFWPSSVEISWRCSLFFLGWDMIIVGPQIVE